MRLPSVKTLMQLPNFTKGSAMILRQRMIEGTALSYANVIMQGFGTETIPAGNNQRSPKVTYVNMGDPYVTTLLLVDEKRYSVGCWGSIVERGDYN